MCFNFAIIRQLFLIFFFIIRNKIYIEQTENLEKRLLKHNKITKNKKSSFINKQKGKWILIYKDLFETRRKAIKREKNKKFSRTKFYKE